jgi:hypothetical protein
VNVVEVMVRGSQRPRAYETVSPQTEPYCA